MHWESYVYSAEFRGVRLEEQVDVAVYPSAVSMDLFSLNRVQISWGMQSSPGFMWHHLLPVTCGSMSLQVLGAGGLRTDL